MDMRKKFISCILAGAVILSTAMPASAKTYYNMKFGDIDKKQISVIDRAEEKIQGLDVGYEILKSEKTEDFNGDGIKEKVKLSRKYSSDYKKSTVTLSIGGKTQLKFNIGKGFSSQNISFSTVKLGSDTLAILLYGDEDFAGGCVKIYKWNKDNTLKKLMSHDAKGYLGTFISSDKKGGSKRLYITESEQIYLGNKEWPKAAPKKYIKWKNQSNVSVTKTTHKKYNLKNGKLTKTGSDTFYRIGGSYD